MFLETIETKVFLRIFAENCDPHHRGHLTFSPTMHWASSTLICTPKPPFPSESFYWDFGTPNPYPTKRPNISNPHFNWSRFFLNLQGFSCILFSGVLFVLHWKVVGGSTFSSLGTYPYSWQRNSQSLLHARSTPPLLIAPSSGSCKLCFMHYTLFLAHFPSDSTLALLSTWATYQYSCLPNTHLLSHGFFFLPSCPLELTMARHPSDPTLPDFWLMLRFCWSCSLDPSSADCFTFSYTRREREQQECEKRSCQVSQRRLRSHILCVAFCW